MRDKLLKQIESKIDKEIKRALEKSSVEVEKRLRKYIQKEWYDSYKPEYYERTYQFINSITRTKVVNNRGRMSIAVYFDNDKIRASRSNKGLWNQHMSINGIDVSDAIVSWIEYGNNPNNKPAAIYSYEGIGMIQHMVDWLEKEYTKLFRKNFKYKLIAK